MFAHFDPQHSMSRVAVRDACSQLSLILPTLKPNEKNSVCENVFLILLPSGYSSKPYSSGSNSGHRHSPCCYLASTNFTQIKNTLGQSTLMALKST